ncbi:MAG: glycosyltransferase [Bacteroidota bacterium]
MFNDVSLLITHYNRSESLRYLLKAVDDLKLQFGQIVISDDCSSIDHLKTIKSLAERYNAVLVTTEKNGGLGDNINKGQDKVTLPYTLYIQEDFRPKKSFIEPLQDALDFMQADSDLDLVRFYAYKPYPYLKPYGKGFSKMIFDLKLKGYGKFYAYSDHPHLRRSSFPQKFGKYKLGHNPEQTEYRMMMSYLQNNGQGLFYDNFKSLFEHMNSSDEPSTMKRNSIRRGNNPVVVQIRHLYRHLKFNANYVFSKY